MGTTQIGNIIVLSFFGTQAERILGAKKTAVLVLTAFVAQLGISLVINAYGDGISGIAWAFAPILIPQTFRRLHQAQGRFWKDPFLLAALPLYLAVWLVITAVSLRMGMINTNIWHAVATLVGLFFMILWRKGLEDQQPADTKHDQLTARLFLVIPILLLGLLLAAWSGFIPYTSSAKLVKIEPPSGLIQQLNERAGLVEMVFDQPMGPNFSVHRSVYSETGDLHCKVAWIDPFRLQISFSRSIDHGERIELTISKLKDQEGLPLNRTISLQYW